MTLLLRYMTVHDIAEVVAIDRVSFDPAWSAHSYAYEVEESNYSHMVVLDSVSAPGEYPVPRLWERLKGVLLGHRNGARVDAAGRRHQVIGYGGLWHIMDEAHISTIAVHPDWRGRGYGEVVLAGMIHRSLTLNAAYLVLEVRVSNVTAQNLYRKYGFEIVDTKRNYYRNNNEDAYDMRLYFDAEFGRRFVWQFNALRARCPFENHYSSALASPK